MWCTLLCLGLWSGCVPARNPVPVGGGIAPAAFRRVPIGLGEDYPKEARSPGVVRRDLELLRTNGVHLLRISLPWDEIEPEPGRYEWGFWDRLITVASRQYGLRLLPYVCYTPRWAAARQTEDFWRQPPRDNALFAEFVRQAARRYKGRIQSWELWNEPDNPEYWRGSVEQFQALLQAGSAAVRQADPGAKVVLGGLSWNLDFLEAMLTNRAVLQDVDVINLHNYYETWSADPLERLTDYLGRAQDILRSHGRPLPLWMAEVGYSSFHQGSYVSREARAFYRYEHTPEHQASALFRILSVLLASEKVSLVTWYRVNDLLPGQEVIGDLNNRYLGVVSAQGQPKPALQALSYFQGLFAGGYRCLDRQVRISRPLASAAQAHVFARPDGSVVVTAWLQTVVPGERGGGGGQVEDRREEEIELELPLPAADKAAVFNELGQSRGSWPVEGHGSGCRIRGLNLRDGGVTVLILAGERSRAHAPNSGAGIAN